ncbi:tripartite tricarboxylate transporter TctB family protein [Bosea sp. (in: a-proteobacteria)]|uniref:tripartite tricarboxylate transporter TctB family protein n=1 Tax=Bosea sp. (in: a-proteobacteria) TaxID=1871050 RepID=UPI002FC92D72
MAAGSERPTEAEPDRPIVQEGEASEGMSQLLSGILFMAIGTFALYLGRGYPVGSAGDMGPGYLPRLVAIGLVLVGLACALRGWLSGERGLPRFPLRAGFWIGGAVLAFALLIERAGLFVACLVAVLIAGGAEMQRRWRELPLVALVLAGFCALLFGYALRLPMQVWPL